MKKLLLIMMALFLWTGMTWGQANSYIFSSSSGTYTAITGGTILKDGTSSMDSWVSGAITIPSFTFSGVAYTTAYVTSNGLLNLGGTAPSSTSYTAISSTTGSGISICPFNGDLDRATTTASSEMRWETVGNEVVFQWSQIKRYGSTNVESFDMQARLNTSNGVIKFVYKLNTGPGSSTSYYPQVGLRTSTTDYTNRLVGTGAENWATTLAGTANSSQCRFTSVAPAKNFSSGLTYTWTPPSCSAPTALTVSNLTATTATIGWTAPASAPSGGYQWEVRTSGAAGSGATGLAASDNTTAGITTVNVSGLTSVTNYTLHVRSNCGGDYSGWVNTTFSTLLCDPANQCAYTVNLTDAYNDGWDGTVLGFKQNGIIVATFGNGFTSGGTFGPVVANLCDALPTQIVVVTLGSYVGEKGFIVYDPFGVEIFRWNSGGVFTISTIFHTFTSNCTPPACDAPTNLQVSNQTQNSAQLSWTPGSTETEWKIEWGIAGFNQGQGTTINNVTNNSYTLTGLTQATHYQYYVSGNCETRAYSNWSGPFTFSTLSSPITSFPFFEGFEVAYFPPAGWQSKDEDGDGFNWTKLLSTNLYPARTGTGSAGSASFDNPTITPLTPDNWLISPAISIPSTGEFVLDYYVAAQDAVFPAEKYGVYISTTGTDPASFTQAYVETLSSTTYTLKTVNLFAYNGQTIYLAWRHFDCTDQFFLKIDDVKVRMLPPPCPMPASQPTNLVLNPSSTSISGSYTAATGATGHLVLRSSSPTLVTLPQNNTNYSTGNAIGTATVVYAGTNTTTFSTTGLSAFTQYYFFVFAYNSGAECAGPVYRTVSPLTGSSTTLPPAPGSLTATPQSTSQISLTGVANTFIHNVLVAWNTTNVFGTPAGIIGFGSQIPGGGTVHYLGSANEIPNHNNLNGGTQYYYRAWSFVDGATRVYSSTSANATATTFFTAPYLQDFNGTYLPAGWYEASGDVPNPPSADGAWVQSTNFANQSGNSKAVKMNVYSVDNDWLISPGIDLGSVDKRLSFKVAATTYNLTGSVQMVPEDKVYVLIKSINGVWNLDNALEIYTAGNTPSNTGDLVTVSLEGWTGVVNLAFYTKGSGTSPDMDIHFDDFLIEDIPTEPVFFVNPTEKNFGTVSIFAPPVPQVFTIKNNGVGVLEISSILLGGPNPDQFTLVDNNDYPIELGEGEQTTVLVNFKPNSDGPKTGFLVVNDNLSAKVQRAIPLQGVGVDPTITSFPWFESFESSGTPPILSPTGWINYLWDNSKYGGARTGIRWAYSNNNGSRLTTPPIQLPDDGLTYTFSAYYRAESADYPQDFDVLLSTDGTNFDEVVFEGRGVVSTAYQIISMDLDEYAGETIYLRFDGLYGTGGYAYGICIDDVSVFSPLAHTFVPSNLSCFESNDGSISVTIQGGTPPYTVTWYGPGFEPVTGTTTENPVATGLVAGVYQYTVKDGAGTQQSSQEITLTQPAAVPVPTTSNLTVSYDGLVKTLTAVAPAGTSLRWYNVAEGGTAIVSPAATNAGVYNFWVSALNVELGCESVRVPATLTIQKKNLTVIADNQNKCQNTPLPVLTISYVGFVAGEGIANLISLPMASTTALPNSAVGTYPITVSGGTSNNYSFTYQNGTLTIIRTPIISAGDPGFVCVSESFPIVGASASNFGTLLWTSSGNGVFSNTGIVNPVYTPGNQDIINGNVTLTLTGDPGSFCSVSDEILLTLQNDLPVSVTITQADNEICLNEVVVFNAFPVNGGITPSYQWKVNGVNAGNNNSIFTYVPTNGDVVTVVLTTSISCAINNTAISNAITLTVIPDLTAEVFITTLSEAVCDFTPTTYTAFGTNGGLDPTYQWKVNGVNAGTDNTVFTYVPLDGDVVEVMMTSSHSCAVVPVANSNAITMSVAPPLLELIANPENGGTVSGGGYYADGTEVDIVALPEIGWEFLNWKNGDGMIVSTDSAFTFTISNCYEQLTATFSSRAKIVGQLKYFNEQETLIPSPNENGVFYVQLFHQGVAFSERQMVKHSLEAGLDSYFEFAGVESGKEYTLRVWEEAINNILDNTWTWNNWGGASSIDALAINYMTIQSNILSGFPWIMPVENSVYTPYFSDVANVNSDANITSLDALLLMNRIVGLEGSSPFPSQTNNFQLATTKLDAHEEMAYPNAPELLLGAVGNYAAAASAPQYYHEIELVNLSDGLNVFNIYFVATGDMNASYFAEVEAKSSESLEYNNIIAAEVGDEILIPLLINQNAEVNAITLGVTYNNQILEVTEVVGYDIYNIDHETGSVRIAWMSQSGKVFGQGQEVVVLKAKILSDIHSGTRFAELTQETEFGGFNASVLQGIGLSTYFIETGATGVVELSSLNHRIFPNPFNDYTNIHYTLPNAGKVQIVVFNHLGQEVIKLMDETQTAGSHQVRLNNFELNGAGTYFYQIHLENEGQKISARGALLLMK